MKKAILFLVCAAAFAQQAEAPAPIQLNQSERMEFMLIRSEMRTLGEQLENLRLRACMRAAATDCAGWSPDGAAVILRQPAPQQPQPATSPVGAKPPQRP